jgi:sugar lactone lactonase YvrE
MVTHTPSRSRKAGLALLVACATIAGATGAAGAADRTDVAPAATSSTVPMRLMSVYGVTGEGPNSLVMDSSGNVYTVNSKSDNVTRITPEGNVQVIGATGKQPMGIALDSAGNVYTSNFGDGTVTKITPAGVSSVLGTTGRTPMGIRVDSSGNVYTSNYLDSTVTKITPAGVSSVLARTGTHPLGIILDGAGNVYTANEGSNSITKITPAGVATTLGTTGAWPQAIAMDAAGNLYTANWNSSNVSKVTPAGKSTILGVTGNRPIGITVDAAGNVYTTNNGADNVSRITQKGESQIIAVTERRPSGITVDSAGNLYMVNFLSDTVTKVAAGKPSQPNTLTFSTVTVAAPGNDPAWIIPFYNDVYKTQQSCLDALPAVTESVQADPDPAVQKESATSCMSVGAVPYTYGVGETEITTSQWVTFLNFVDPNGTNTHRLWDVAESSSVWPKYGSINRNLKAAPGQRYYLSSPGWANRPYNQADFSRSARFVNSLFNGKVLSKNVDFVTTVAGTSLKRTNYTVRLSTNTESGMYDMSNPKTTRTAKKGFAITSQNEWIKAAYFDPKGEGKFSYWDYPTNPGLFVNCKVDEEGCAEGEQPNAVVMDANGNVTNSDQQPLASFEAVPGTAPDWCPVISLTSDQCTADAPFPPVLPYNGNTSPVGQALTRSPWGTLDQGGNVVEVLDTISPPPALGDTTIVWRRWHGGVVTATAYQMWLSAVGTTPQTIPGYAINPWRGFRISVRGL